MKYVPEEVRVKKGDTVVWKSHEKRGYHTVWSKDDGMNESEPLFPDESWRRTFENTGRYPYVCGPYQSRLMRLVPHRILRALQ